jgi:hypothetical protein
MLLKNDFLRCRDAILIQRITGNARLIQAARLLDSIIAQQALAGDFFNSIDPQRKSATRPLNKNPGTAAAVLIWIVRKYYQCRSSS